jgi:uncharacterized protein with PhoU and TrkA domain
VLGNVTVVGPLLVKVKSIPIPERLTTWIAVVALSVIVRVPLTGPAAEEVKTIESVHAALTANVELQALAAMRNPVDAEMLEIFSARPPLLVSVSV